MAEIEHRYVMSSLLEGWDWFDSGLQIMVRAAGFEPLNKSQSMMMMYLSEGVTRPADIARKMRLSRQAIRHIANELIDQGVVVARDDPDDGRSKILSFSEKATPLRLHAQETIFRLEALLYERLGHTDFEALKRILARDWGPSVRQPEDLGGMPEEVEARRKATKRTLLGPAKTPAKAVSKARHAAAKPASKSRPARRRKRAGSSGTAR